MLELPEKLLDFGKWWLLIAPLRIFKISRNIIVLFNNELSFTLNLRLMFTPLFGDYTIMGRIIGFIFRIVEIIVGLAVLITLGLFSLLLPIAWWLLPLAAIYRFGVWPALFVPVAALCWYITQLNLPRSRINKVDEKNILDAFRPKSLETLDEPKRALNENWVKYLLKKAELLDESFVNDLINGSFPDSNTISKKAFEFAKKHNMRYVEPEHVLLALISLAKNSQKLLASHGLEINLLEETVRWIVEKREDLAKVYFWQEDYPTPLIGGIGKGMTGRTTPFLNSVSQDFTRLVKKGSVSKIVGREKEISEIASILGGSKVNVLIIGEPGSGKTSIVKGIAYKIFTGTEFEPIKFKRIVSLDISSVIAGTKSQGEIAERLKRVIEEVEASGNIILFIDEIHSLISVNTEGTENSNIFSILEPHLSAGKIQFIGATNMENYRKHIEPNGAFARLFQLVEIPEASKEDSKEILKFTADKFEKEHSVIISFPAIHKAVELSEKLIHERVLPDKSIDILNRTVVHVQKSTKYVDSDSIAQTISNITHIPVTSVTEDESKKLLNIESELKKRVIGQDEAIKQIGAALKRARAGIRNENKPIASFLFVGSTGVGKTETAKALAKAYFGDEKIMIRLDMSEYQQPDSINRLIGLSDGKSLGILTEAVRTKPFSLILLDEIEKSYSNILLTFLQVLDDGRLTDSAGHVVDFTNSIIIATSNVGTRALQQISQNSGTTQQMHETVMKEVRAKFAPEFLNRFNGIIVFNPLDRTSLIKVCDLMLDSVREMASNKGITVTFKPELIDELIKRGFRIEWGARPLSRTIENSVESYLAVKLLSQELKQGDSVELGLEVFSE